MRALPIVLVCKRTRIVDDNELAGLREGVRRPFPATFAAVVACVRAYVLLRRMRDARIVHGANSNHARLGLPYAPEGTAELRCVQGSVGGVA